MNRYAITYMDMKRHNDVTGRAGVVVNCGEVEAKNAAAALEAFTAERDVAEHYTHGNRNSVWGMGVPTITARKVTA